MKIFSCFHFAFLALITLSIESARADGSSWVSDDTGYSYSAPAPARASQRSSRSYSSRDSSRMRELAPFSPTSNNVSVEIGQIFLMGDQSTYSDSIGGALRYNYGVSRMFGFDSSLGYSNHSDGKYSMLSLTGGVRMNLATMDRLIPNLKLGMGFYHPSREVNSNASVSGTLFGLYAGGGLDLQISRQTFFGASMNLHNVFGSTKDTSAGLVELGGSYLSFLASVGYTF